MRRRYVAFISLLTLAACRTIVGIDEDFRGGGGPGGPGGGPGGDAAPDADSGTAAADAGADRNLPPLTLECIANQQCPQCCKAKYRRVVETFEDGRGRTCMCKADTCGTAQGPQAKCSVECDAGASLRPSSGGTATPPACIQCVDEQLSTERRDPCIEQSCGDDKECRDGLECLRECPKK